MNVTTVFAFVALLLGSFFLGRHTMERSQARSIEDLTWYRENILTRQGWSQGFGNYRLVSLDGGKNWVATSYVGKEVKVLGDAETVLPGLVAHLDGMDALTKYVEQNGPITLTGPQVAEQVHILQNAGFQVEPR